MPERIFVEYFNIASKFQHHMRGVETKLILKNTAAPRGETLFRNIALAHRYFDMIRKGKTYGEIAEIERASKRRIHNCSNWLFLRRMSSGMYLKVASQPA